MQKIPIEAVKEMYEAFLGMRFQIKWKDGQLWWAFDNKIQGKVGIKPDRTGMREALFKYANKRKI